MEYIVMKKMWDKFISLFSNKLNKCEFIKHPANSSWMLTDNLKPNWEELKKDEAFCALKGCKQSSQWHKEGDVWNHTVLVANEAYKIIETNGWLEKDKYKAKVLMLSALCHDLGKPSTTYYDEKDKEYHCKNHGAVGEKIVRNLLADDDIYLRESICWLVRNHMTFHYIMDKDFETRIDKLEELSYGPTTIECLLLLNMADSLGSKSEETEEHIKERFDFIKQESEEYGWYNKQHEMIVDDNKINAYIMVGIAGAGKDTYIKKFLPDLPVICRDDIREEITGISGHRRLSKEDEQNVTRIANERIANCVINKRNFVINQTSLKKKYRDDFVNLINENGGANIIMVYVEAPSPLNDCIKRRDGEIDEKVITNMWNNIEMPTRKECDYLIVYKEK